MPPGLGEPDLADLPGAVDDDRHHAVGVRTLEPRVRILRLFHAAGDAFGLSLQSAEAIGARAVLVRRGNLPVGSTFAGGVPADLLAADTYPVSGAVYRGVMTRLSYDRYCAEIVAQTDLLTSSIKGADLTVPVPSCPGWNLRQLLRHLGGAHRWVETILRTRATQPPSDDHFRDLSGYTDEDPAVLGVWLAEGAAQLADALRAAGPDAEMWTPVAGESAVFYARRFAHETAVHRADAALAVGAEFTLDEEVALDALDEWMELGSLPQMFEYHPEQRELLGPGRTLHFHATDTAPESAAEWLVDLTGDVIVWRRTHEKAAVAVRGPLTDLLLVIYRRRPVRSEGIEVLGDARLLDFWLERVSFG